MEVFVSAPSFRLCNLMFPDGSAVRDVVSRFTRQQGVSLEDFYVIRNGRLSDPDDPLQHGAVYHLEPRLCGGKGGFGSMLRALGAQIEKTTNREACRDLSGRRLRDVNHEKEMAEWLKKQAEREAEKEQRRLERLQRKLREPKHQFTDPEYQQQCHDLSERLEDSVIKGLQASSSGQVKVDDVSTPKRPNSDQSEQQHPKKKKKMAAVATACFWTGVDELLSSEDDDEESPSTSSSGCGAAAVAKTTQPEEAEPEQSCSSSAASDCSSPSADQTAGPPEDHGHQEDHRPPEDHGHQEDHRPPEDHGHQEDHRPPEDHGHQEDHRPPEDHGPPAEDSSSEQQQRRSLDLSSMSSVDDLESLGLDVLKEELMSRGLKCGGTLTERAARLFSVRGLTPDQIDPALLTKPGKSKRK